MTRRVAVVIKTLKREQAFFNTVRGIREHIGLPYRFYIADDGPASEKKEALYRELLAEGHMVARFAEPIGVSHARNFLIRRLRDEAFVLRMDDDFELTAETDVPAKARLLDHVPALGAVAGLERQVGTGKGVLSGQISPSQGFLLIQNRTLIKKIVPLSEFEYHEVAGVRYAYCDHSRNLLLIRREVFDKVAWEEDLPFDGEHADFLLQLKAAGWKVAFTPQSIHLHREDLARGATDQIQYRQYKHGWDAILPVYRRKWGVDRIILERPLSLLVKAGFIRALVSIQSRLRPRSGTRVTTGESDRAR